MEDTLDLEEQEDATCFKSSSREEFRNILQLGNTVVCTSSRGLILLADYLTLIVKRNALSHCNVEYRISIFCPFTGGTVD